MRTPSTDMQTYLAAGGKTAWFADLYSIVPKFLTTVYRYTNSDVPVTYGGNTYTLGPGIKRSKTTWSLTLEVNTLELEFAARDGDYAFNQLLASGGMDGASVTLQRVISAVPGSAWLDVVQCFTGRMGQVQGGGSLIKASVRSLTSLLDQPFPRNVYQPQCGNTLGDGLCKVNVASYRSTGTVVATVDPPNAAFTFSGITGKADGYFSLGILKFLTGANAGYSMMVKTFTPDYFIFARPWRYAIAAGDTFEVFAGCDQTMATCTGTFGNLANFRGQPFIPVPETTL